MKRTLGALAVLSALNFIPAEAHPHKSYTGRKGYEKITTGIIIYNDGDNAISHKIQAKNITECKRVLNRLKQSFLDVADSWSEDDARVWINCVNIAIK